MEESMRGASALAWELKGIQSRRSGQEGHIPGATRKAVEVRAGG